MTQESRHVKSHLKLPCLESRLECVINLLTQGHAIGFSHMSKSTYPCKYDVERAAMHNKIKPILGKRALNWH